MSIITKVSAYNRHRKWDCFVQNISLNSSIRVLDAGFSEREYSPMDNFIEKKYPYPEMLVALGIETPDEFLKRYPHIGAVQYDGGVFPFSDKEFDVCWSNAVIEHVGNQTKQLIFLKEIKRVSKIAFITTPNKYFPIEIHTRTPLLHYLPRSLFESYLIAVGKGWATGEYMHLLGLEDIHNLLKLAEIIEYKIVANKILGITLDFVIIF